MVRTAAAEPPLKLIHWGSPTPVFLVPPEDLPPLYDIEAGGGFVVGRDANGLVHGWGIFGSNVPYWTPEGLGPTRLVRAGSGVVLAVDIQNKIWVWGGQVGLPLLAPPSGLLPIVDAAVHTNAAIVLLEDGTVVAWGLGQVVTQVPRGLSGVVDVSLGAERAMAVLGDGDAICWGVLDSSICPVPAEVQGQLVEVEHSASMAVALREDGSVTSWGMDRPPLPSPSPSDLQGCSEVVSSVGGELVGAVTAAGTPYIWGNGLASLLPPATLPGPVKHMAISGTRAFALIDEFTDCNANGLDDSAEIEAGTALDCNGDWIPDSCQFASGVVEDCNGNGLADACEKSAPFSAESSELGPLGYGSPQSWTVQNAPAAATHVTLSLSAMGDFSSVSEYAIVRLNDEAIGVAFVNGTDCTETGPEDFTILASTFNTLVDAGGDATISIEPTIAVNADSCPAGSWVKVSMSYNRATDLDCNANGLLDQCEIAEGYAEDCNLDGIPDSCQETDADCNANGAWDACDIASGAAVDCNANGVPDSCDIGATGEGDCNGNGQFDACEIANGTEEDCDDNGVPDACDVKSGRALDCNGNGLPDSCDIASGTPDCNKNGVPDSCDIGAGTASDINNNGVPDECEGLECPGDLTGDHLVNGADLAVLLGFWGPVGSFASADIDGSGTVDAGDLAILLGGWGTCQ
ncbi:MAG: hypothetical protein JNL80_09120 [Phycisphaerae bacterium]|nr:hypothetical protein [Phycisphaerae bacterium]